MVSPDSRCCWHAGPQFVYVDLSLPSPIIAAVPPIAIPAGAVAGLARTVWYLVKLPAKTIDLTYSAGNAPFQAQVNTMIGPYQYGTTIHRVGVKNRTFASIDDVNVYVAAMEPDPIGNLSVRLRVMHEDVPPPALTVARSATPNDYIDVLGVPQHADLKEVLFLFHDVPEGHVGVQIQRQNYRFLLKATARNSRPTERWIRVTVHPNGPMGFMPED